MKHFKFSLNEVGVEFNKNDFHAAGSELFAIMQMSNIDDVKFYIKGKISSLDEVKKEISRLYNLKVEKKELTHKKIFIGDGVTHLNKKAVWVMV